MNAAARPAPSTWNEGGITHIDVRDLPPPQPLVAVLSLIRELPAGAPLVMHHDRMPLLLLPELEEIGWEVERLAAPEGEVRLMLRPPP